MPNPSILLSASEAGGGHFEQSCSTRDKTRVNEGGGKLHKNVGNKAMREAQGETFLPLGNEFFPSGTSQLVLQVRDGVTLSIAKDLAEDGIVCHSKFTTCSLICHINHFNGI